MLKICKIDLVFSILEHKRAVYQLAGISIDHAGEGIVDGACDENRVAGGSQRTHACGDCVDDAGRLQEPILLDIPVKICFLPIGKGIEIVFLCIGIAKNAVRDAGMQCFQNFRRCLKIHIRDPHGQNICAMPALLSEIVLDAVRAQAVMKCIKIILHHIFSPSVLMRIWNNSILNNFKAIVNQREIGKNRAKSTKTDSE